MLDKKTQIAYLLRIALLENGPLSRIVYETVLEDNVKRWQMNMKGSEESYLFAIAESDHEIAMVLIESNQRLYINEAAREKLAEVWFEGYAPSMENLIPLVAEDLAEGALSINAVRHV